MGLILTCYVETAKQPPVRIKVPVAPDFGGDDWGRRDDWFGLRLAQPLRTERGNLKVQIPAGRTRYGEMVANDHTLNLAPTGRHLQVEAV